MWRFLLLLCISKAVSTEEHHKVIIIGAGSAGIAAASKLLENGIDDVGILEAEERIGGRIHSVKLGNITVDMGAHYIRGTEGNVVYEMASPLELLSDQIPDMPLMMKTTYEAVLKHIPDKKLLSLLMNMPFTTRVKYFGSTPLLMTASDYGDEIEKNLRKVIEDWNGVDWLLVGSTGEYLDQQFELYFHQKNISDWLRKPILRSVHLAHMTENGAEDLYKVSAKGERDHKIADSLSIDWMNKTYSTMFDILMKKYPNPEQELPVMNKTRFSKKVSKINYGGDGPTILTTVDGNKYTADYVIFTPSLGVLKAHHRDLFEPNLPEDKINSIQNLGMGHGGKIYLYYDDAWWKSSVFTKAILWSNSDAEVLANDTERSWMLSIYAVKDVEWQPNALVVLLSGSYAKQMEVLPENVVKSQTIWLINKFFTSKYNVTQPREFARSTWSTNDNFLGSNSYRSLDSDKFNASAEDLGKPVMTDDKPILLFAGEATSNKYGSVNGAVESGWREADRIIAHEKKQ